jgi:hypothetical protein
MMWQLRRPVVDESQSAAESRASRPTLPAQHIQQEFEVSDRILSLKVMIHRAR